VQISNTTSLQHFIALTRLNRPIGIYLLLWPSLVAVWIAGQGHPSLLIVCIFTLGVTVMRSAGCIINDWADRHWDKSIARTQYRPLTTGAVSEKTALIWFISLIVLAVSLIIPLNLKTQALSLVALLLAALYPFMKRYTHLPQAFLGISFGWSIPMAFSAQNQPLLTPLVGLLFGIVMTWVLVYDTEYAMVDREDDIKVGIKSTAILWGHHDRWIIGLLQIITLLQLALLGSCLYGRWPYRLALIGIASLFGHQQWQIRQRDPNACFQAFINNHYVGLLWFLGTIFGTY
jgi:4-hydroxybenzoate polyprenyltransferase